MGYLYKKQTDKAKQNLLRRSNSGVIIAPLTPILLMSIPSRRVPNFVRNSFKWSSVKFSFIILFLSSVPYVMNTSSRFSYSGLGKGFVDSNLVL